jgi:two-component system response regulator CpxR
MAIISIFSGSFCHGDEIAAETAKKLNYDIIDGQILEYAAQKSGKSRRSLEQTLEGDISLFDKFTHENENNIVCLTLAVAELTLADNKIVTGTKGHLVSRYLNHHLRVCCIADFDYRIEQAVKSPGIDKKKAKKLIHEFDKRMQLWAHRLFEIPVYDDSLYDIVIPIHTTTIEEAVKLISKYATSEKLATTDRSLKMASDHAFAAKVKTLLAEKNLYGDMFYENGVLTVFARLDLVGMNRFEKNIRRSALEIDGVEKVIVKPAQQSRTAHTNPWANLDLPPKVLLVDDEKDFVQTLSERLQTRNLESSIVYSGEEALEHIDKDQPDVIVLDLMMPGIDGIEVLRRVKKDYPEIEIIILTGHGSDKEKRDSEELGAYAYLQKPVDIDYLAKVMRSAHQKALKNQSSDGKNKIGDRP